MLCKLRAFNGLSVGGGALDFSISDFEPLNVVLIYEHLQFNLCVLIIMVIRPCGMSALKGNARCVYLSAIARQNSTQVFMFES